MKKRIPIYHFVLVGLMFATLFLPYSQWNGGDMSCMLCNRPNPTPVPAYMLSGFHDFQYTILPILGMMFISTITLVARNRFTAIAGVVLSVFLVLSIPIELIGIFFLSQLSMGIGIIFSFLLIFTFLGFNIANLVWVCRNVKRQVNHRSKIQILDTDFV